MRRDKEGVIYCAIWKQTGKSFYVGQTRQKLSQRISGHFNSSKKTVMALTLRQLGRDDVEFKEIEKIAGDSLDERERYWIDKLGTRHPAGLNQSAGGGSGGLHLARSKAKMSEIAKARCAKPDQHARIVARNGKLWADPEYRARQAAGKALAMQDPKYLARMAEVKNEYWSNPENRVQMSAKIKAMWADPERRARQTAAVRAGKAREKAAKSNAFS